MNGWTAFHFLSRPLVIIMEFWVLFMLTPTIRVTTTARAVPPPFNVFHTQPLPYMLFLPYCATPVVFKSIKHSWSSSVKPGSRFCEMILIVAEYFLCVFCLVVLLTFKKSVSWHTVNISGVHSIFPHSLLEHYPVCAAGSTRRISKFTLREQSELCVKVNFYIAGTTLVYILAA